MKHVQLKKKTKVLLFLALVAASFWLYMAEPFKVTDPTDPRFDITKARMRDYKDESSVEHLYKNIFPKGTKRKDIEKIISYLKGKKDNVPVSVSGKNLQVRYFFSYGYDWQPVNYIMAPLSGGYGWTTIIEYDDNQNLVEIYYLLRPVHNSSLSLAR